MNLDHGLHLAYCTNIHRGESWPETFRTLQTHTLAVRDRVAPGIPYAIGLRLSDQASRELAVPSTLNAFRGWLDDNDCYVFTINGFPYGRFHGTRVKEHVYLPDWTQTERVDYTNRLFDLLAQLLPDGVEGSVSTVPGSFKEFIRDKDQVRQMRHNLWRCVEHIARLSERSGRDLHLGIEPEPLCFLETTGETVDFFGQLRADKPGDERLRRHLGVNYDACHLAVEFEEASAALQRLVDDGIRLSKLHFSSALKVSPAIDSLQSLERFTDDVYLHQVVARDSGGGLTRFRDLHDALNEARQTGSAMPVERRWDQWRIHFHIPLHHEPAGHFSSTSGHLLEVMDFLAAHPKLCSHIEMETYTWEVLPSEMKGDVVDQLVEEYRWTLAQLGSRGIHPAGLNPRVG